MKSLFTLTHTSRVSRFAPFAIRYALFALLFLLPFLFFWRLFAPNPLDRLWLPAGDLTLQYYPLRVFAARALANGNLPLWNPHMYAGQPALADSQMAVLYPINLLTALALAALGRPFTFGIFQLQIVLHYSLAAVFTYLFAHRLTHKTFAAFSAALVFTFGGYLISYPVQQPTILASAVWLPLVLWCLDHAASPDLAGFRILSLSKDGNPRGLRRVWWLACAGAAMAMSMLAGHPQTFTYVFYTAIGYWIFRYWILAIGYSNSKLQYLISNIQRLTVFVAFALSLSAAQLLPTLEFTRYSTRAQLGYPFTSGGFALHELVTILIPGYFGGSPLYVGIIPLLLALYAILANKIPNPQSPIPTSSAHPSPLNPQPPITNAKAPLRYYQLPTTFWLALALIALFLSLGDSSFLYSLFYLFAPGFAQIRNQERAAFLWSFALAMLAAIGAARLALPSGKLRRVIFECGQTFLRWAMVTTIALVALAYLGALANEGEKVNLFPGVLRQLVPTFFYLLVAWALWRLRFRAFVSRRWLMASVACLIGLNLFSVNGSYNFQQPTPPNYFPETTLTRALLAELRTNPLARVASEGLLPGEHNAGADYGFADINGNDPLHLQATETFDQAVNELRKFQLLGVQYVVTKRAITHGAFTLLATEGDARLYHYTEAMPRAWLVHHATVIPAEKIFATLNSHEFNHQMSVVLSSPSPIALAVPPQPTDGVAITQHGAGHLTIQTASTTNGLLVISEIFYPGWKAYVDGQAAPIMSANGLLLAVPMPSGSHKIELTYDPDWWKIGMVVSTLSLLLWGSLGMALLWQSKRVKRET